MHQTQVTQRPDGRWKVERWEPGRRIWVWIADFDTEVEARWHELNLPLAAVAGRHRRALHRARQSTLSL